MDPSTFPLPPGYRLAAVNHHHVMSRQSNSVDARPDVTSRDVYRAGSRGVDRGVSVPHSTSVLSDRIFDKERSRRLSGPNVDDRDAVGTRYQRPTATTSSWARPATTAATYSLTRELGCGHTDVMAGSTATSRLFGSASHHPQFHESSYSAPADCTARRRRPRAVPAALLPCGAGVRATTVSVRTEYHRPSTRRFTAASSSIKDGQRSSSRSQQGANLWLGVAHTVDVRPVSATAIVATVDCNNRELYINYYLYY